MTILSKRLDEWIAEIPVFLRDVKKSPYPSQACYILVGRNNIRLYILKPFLYDYRAALPPATSQRTPTNGTADSSILRKMLLPQCTSHARSSLWALHDLHEVVGVPINFFILHQGFLSSSTFIMTVWHGTRDVDILFQDRDIIEFALKMFNAEDRFATILLKRAHRILHNIALRIFPEITNEAQKKRFQELLRQHGSAALVPPSLRASADGQPRGSAWTPASAKGNDAKESKAPTGTLNVDASQCDHKSTETFAVGPTFSTMATLTHRTQNGVPISYAKRIPTTSNSIAHGQSQNVAGQGIGNDANTRELSFGSPYGVTPPSLRSTDSASNDIGTAIDELDVRQWLPLSESTTPLPFHADSLSMRSGFEFTGDLSWTDYFSRFLGGLPEPT